MILQILGLLFSLVSFGASILILIHAFKASVGQGFMCLCIPCYILYYGFTQFQHEKKNLILGAWLGCSIIGGGLQGAGASMQAQEMMEQQQQMMQQAPTP